MLFVTDTPYRYYPVEHHTTGLPLLNYAPDRVAFAAARRLSSRVRPAASWTGLLRSGIRGATEAEILEDLERGGQDEPVLLAPIRPGLRDNVDVWYEESMMRQPTRLKLGAKYAFKAMTRVCGGAFVPTLSMAIRKV